MIMLIAVWVWMKQLSRFLKHLAAEFHFASRFKQGLRFIQQNSRKLLFGVRMPGSTGLFDRRVFMFQAFAVLIASVLIIEDNRARSVIK